jgi:mono/diheme cytochrome c family protein
MSPSRFNLKGLNNLLLFSLSALFFFSCRPENTNSDFLEGQKELNESGGSTINRTTPGGERLYAAYSVMQAHCFSCHGNWSAWTTDQMWLDSRRVFAGAPDQSPLMTSLWNYGGDMPRGGGPLTPAETSALSEWILGL